MVKLIKMRIINRNKYIEKNLCITLVIYQESLQDARSTECKKYGLTLVLIFMYS